MSEKRYTSQEMRDIARQYSDMPCRKKSCSGESCIYKEDCIGQKKIVSMLIQAADLEEELKRSIAERDALKAKLAESDAKWASRVELQKRCTDTVQNELNQVHALLDETRLKWSCHEAACKTCPCRASKTDETGRTRHLCDCTRQETVLGNMEKNCSKFANYDAAVAAFRKFCNSERGMPCGDCPYAGEKLSCMARWLMD